MLTVGFPLDFFTLPGAITTHEKFVKTKPSEYGKIRKPWQSYAIKVEGHLTKKRVHVIDMNDGEQECHHFAIDSWIL